MRSMIKCLLIIVLMTSLALISCAKPSAPGPAATPKPTLAPAPAPKPAVAAAWDKEITIGAKEPPSTTYVMATAVLKTLNAHAKDFTAHVSVFGSDSAYPEAFQKGELDLGVMGGPTVYMSANAQKAWKVPMPVRVLGFGPPQYYGIIANINSGIKTPADLKGKKWMAIRPGSQLLDDIRDAISYAYGLDKTNTTFLNHSSTDEIVNALKEGRVDAALWIWYEKTPWVEELTMLGKAMLVSDTEAALEKIRQKYPSFVRLTLPAGTYKGQDKEIVTFGSTSILTIRETLPVDQVYAITSILFNNFEEWKNYYEAEIKYYKLPESIAPKRISVPFHEGTLKYFKDKGYWTAEHEKVQKALLDQILALKK